MHFQEYQLIRPGNIPSKELGHNMVSGKTIHPTVARFLTMTQEDRARAYCNAHPEAEYDEVMELLTERVQYLKWSGSDLLNVRDAEGRRMKYVLETNSCPSGSKDFPTEASRITGSTPYELILRGALLPQLMPEGNPAVVYDKNEFGNVAYARTLANLTRRDVYLVPLLDSEAFRFDNPRRLTIGTTQLAGIFRYVTQKPWNRLSVNQETPMTNPIIGCIAGGRNKLLAAKAYREFNANARTVRINIPLTTEEMSREEVIRELEKWGGIGVIKNPYSNAGVGVYTITSEREIDDFIREADPSGKFILQQLIGNDKVKTNGKIGPLVHIGTRPIKGEVYAMDVRMSVVNTPEGFVPVSMYGRRARAPLDANITATVSSWDLFGTNLSVKLGVDRWALELEEREIVVTPEAFDSLNVDLDDLVEIYVQTVCCNVAINRMAGKLMEGGRFQSELFDQINKDPNFNDTILQ